MPESSIKCPICGAFVPLADQRAPFCSERCKLLDLGNWASGRYQISRPLLPEELAHEAVEHADDTDVAQDDGQ